MIGQKQTRQDLLEFINSSANSTAILCGDVGSGKKTLINEVVKNYGGLVYNAPDVKKETIKALIDQVYKTYTPTIYIIPDIDNMSIAAMNSLLKITEEPPNVAKIILTCSNTSAILDTIYSRALKYFMQPYTKEELKEYYKAEDDFIYDVCNTPGDINIIVNQGIQEFKDYVQLVFNNIDKVSGTNSLKIGSKIAFKEDSEGFDLRLFFIAFERLCLNAYKETKDFIYEDWARITALKLQDLRTKAINKSALFDIWVLDIREVSI